MNNSLFLFRNDLRLDDNPALFEAARTKQPLLLLYVLEEKNIGAAQRWWLHHSLKSLSQTIELMGCQLVLRRGPLESVLEQIVSEQNITKIYYNRVFEPEQMERDERLKKRFSIFYANGSFLLEPGQPINQSGTAFKVFTPFWKTAEKEILLEKEKKIEKLIPFKKIKSEQLDDFNLLPKNPDWASEFGKHFEPGEAGAKKALNRFLETAINNYSEGRDLPGIEGTSRLSPHLHFGEISPQTIWRAVQHKDDKHGKHFRSELGWREFSNYQLFHFPKLVNQPFNSRFAQFEWDENPELFKAWKEGKTGYPIVDAGMRQLWKTGWMHNRVRMIVASFLTKDLMLHWTKGERWFWDTLLDADLANNCAGWQWVAGCGADAAPYFRIFNPALQGERFDPDGTYIKQFCPELKNLEKRYIHEPHLAPPLVLKMAGITLGKEYPHPIIDHKVARERALERFKNLPGGPHENPNSRW